MNTIDLDSIREKIDLEGNYSTEEQFNDLCMKEAIHQALLLASENARTITKGWSDGWEYWDVTSVDKQSILDIEKLIK